MLLLCILTGYFSSSPWTSLFNLLLPAGSYLRKHFYICSHGRLVDINAQLSLKWLSLDFYFFFLDRSNLDIKNVYNTGKDKKLQ